MGRGLRRERKRELSSVATVGYAVNTSGTISMHMHILFACVMCYESDLKRSIPVLQDSVSNYVDEI